MRDERILHVVSNLKTAINMLFDKKLKEFTKKYKDRQCEFLQTYQLAFRKALREVDQEKTDKPKKYVHLHCGQAFDSVELAEKHALSDICKPSKKTKAAMEKKLLVLSRKREL